MLAGPLLMLASPLLVLASPLLVLASPLLVRANLLLVHRWSLLVCVAVCMGFNTWSTQPVGQCMGFKRYNLKTRANASNKHVDVLKTCVKSSRVSPSESKWVQ